MTPHELRELLKRAAPRPLEVDADAADWTEEQGYARYYLLSLAALDAAAGGQR